MIHNLERKLGKLLFPRSEHWKRRQKVRILFAIFLVEIVIGGVVLLLLLQKNSR
jgi:hypothetical protein